MVKEQDWLGYTFASHNLFKSIQNPTMLTFTNHYKTQNQPAPPFKSKYVKVTLKAVMLFLVAGVIITAFYFNFWLGVACSLLAVIYTFRSAISFFFYILSLDFDFDDNITKELERMDGFL